MSGQGEGMDDDIALYDDLEKLETDYNAVVGGMGSTEEDARDDAYDKLPTTAGDCGECLYTDEDEGYFLFVGYNEEEQTGGGSFADDMVEDTLDPW